MSALQLAKQFCHRHAAPIIVAVSFFLVFGYALWHQIEPAVDAYAYDQIAQNIVAGHGFKELPEVDFDHDMAITRAGPGYEYFLAGIFRVFGHHYAVVWFIQALLHALTAYIIILMGRRLWPERSKIALLAGIIFGWHPDLIEIGSMLMTETLYLFLVTVPVYLFIRLYQEPMQSLKWSVYMGVSLVLAILSRPTVVLFVPIMGLWYWCNRQFKAAALLLIILTAGLTPWTLRNWYRFHEFIPTTLIGSYNIWLGNTLESVGGQFSAEKNPLNDFAAAHGYVAMKYEASRQFKQFIVTHPVSFIHLSFVRVVRYFSLIRPMGFWFYQHGLPQLIFVVCSATAIALLWVSGFSGLIGWWGKRDTLLRYLIALAITAPLPLLLTVVQSRYRFQIYPFLALSGAWWLASWRQDLRLRYIGYGVVASLLVISLIDARVFLPVIIERLHQIGLFI